MRRTLLVVAVLGAACGQQQATEPPTPAAAAVAVTTSAVTTSMPAAATTASVPVATARSAPGTTLPPPPSTFVVWMPDGLANDFAELVMTIEGVEKATVALSDTAHLVESHSADGRLVDRAPDGFFLPVLTLGLDVASYPDFVAGDAAAAIRSLGPGEVLLGASSAELRRLESGDRITFEGGVEMTVAAVVDDEAVGSAEVVVAGTDLFPRVDRGAMYVLIDYEGSAVALEASITARLPIASEVHVRAIVGEDLQPRSPVRPQVFIKQVFGEFAYRPTFGGQVLIDPAWKEANIVERHLPLLGFTTCHRLFAELLTNMMQDLIDEGLAHLIDPGAFAGCWSPRYIAGYTRLSRHAWGAAADINFFNALDGAPGSPVNVELLRRFDAAGITSGHGWKSADPGHFEYFGNGAEAVP